jgi:hypothetical protein
VRAARAVVNKRGDEMISDLKLQSSRAQHPTWFLLGRRWPAIPLQA